MLKMPINFSLMFDYCTHFCQNLQSTLVVNICVKTNLTCPLHSLITMTSDLNMWSCTPVLTYIAKSASDDQHLGFL